MIGSGAAGLGLALSLADHAKIAIISKDALLTSSSQHAQGGIAAVMNQDEEADIQSHINDTLKTGSGLCDPEVVAFTVKNAKPAIEWLIGQGVQFTVNQDMKTFHLTQEGGHNHRRILHAADKTGAVVISTLAAQALAHPNIDCSSEHTAIDLILQNKKCVGATVLDNKTQEIIPFYAKETILATGGASTVYQHTTNPGCTSGDGIAMAYRAGCRIANMEFNQFHPTLLYTSNTKPFLISEALRGEGAKLILPNGERFMAQYDERAEMAPRDIVARAIDRELKTNHLDYIYLDISHQPADMIQSYFPTIYAYCLQQGIDITKEPIPVIPAAHYTCGGVVTNLKGQTDIPQLYAIGEAACTGLHGANRMASNSLLECLVFATSASQAITKDLMQANYIIPEKQHYSQNKKITDLNIEKNIASIRKIMWHNVGIVRNNEQLFAAQEEITQQQHKISEDFSQSKTTEALLKLRNLSQVSDLIIQSAMQRKESRGLHYNLDYLNTSSDAKNTILSFSKNKMLPAFS